MTESPSRRQFSALVARPDDEVDLAAASLLIACEEYPDLEVGRYLARLDEMGRELGLRIDGDASLPARVATLNRYLFEDAGFRGNAEDYYDPRNSFLNDVLDRRTGIPITLSTVYMEVAARVGLRAVGVGLPGHFMVRVRDDRQDLLVDPYQAGAVLSEQDCQERLERVFGGKLKVQVEMLAVCSRKHMLARMLRNLKTIYMKAEDHPRALGIVDLLVRVNPQSGEDLRDRGLLYAALDCYGLAARDLAAYLKRTPGAPEAAEFREKLAALNEKARRLN